MATLSELREEAGLTPTELAAQAHISYNTLIRMEAGQAVTRVYVDAVLSALSRTLGRTIALSDVQGVNVR